MLFQDFMCSKWNILVRVSKFEAMYLQRQFAEVSRIGFLRWFLEVFRKYVQGKGKILEILNLEFRSSWIFHQPIGSRWGTRDTTAFFSLESAFPGRSSWGNCHWSWILTPIWGGGNWAVYLSERRLSIYWKNKRIISEKPPFLVRMSSLSLQSTIGKDTPQAKSSKKSVAEDSS